MRIAVRSRGRSGWYRQRTCQTIARWKGISPMRIAPVPRWGRVAMSPVAPLAVQQGADRHHLGPRGRHTASPGPSARGARPGVAWRGMQLRGPEPPPRGWGRPGGAEPPALRAGGQLPETVVAPMGDGVDGSVQDEALGVLAVVYARQGGELRGWMSPVGAPVRVPVCLRGQMRLLGSLPLSFRSVSTASRTLHFKAVRATRGPTDPSGWPETGSEVLHLGRR